MEGICYFGQNALERINLHIYNKSGDSFVAKNAPRNNKQRLVPGHA